MKREPLLEKSTQVWLLNLARETIQAHLEGVDLPDPSLVPEDAGALAGCFVTLKTKAGQLRGCIGTFSESDPLWTCVREMSLRAATVDPRFTPISALELRECWVEISALSSREAIAPEAVIPGLHGLWVTSGAARGVLLPQVATEYQWGREEFLSQTCVKAGLTPNAWKSNEVRIEGFTAEVFSERHSG